MPEGDIDFETKALKYNRGTRLTYEVPTELLLNGENIIAVEHHQFDPTNFEALFDLSLTYNYLPLNNIKLINSDVYNFDLNNNVSLKAVYEKNATYVEEELPRVFINEILSAKSKIRDEFGDRDDYIELYNDEDEAVNVAGWFISDTPIAPKMYQIPTTDEELTTIQPKSYLILWADKEPHQGPLHTNFSLSKNGEFVVLSKLDNYGELQTVDMVRFPALGEEETYSRFPDGSDNWIVQNTTFDLPNDDATDVEYQKISHNIYPTIVSEMIYIENHIGEIFRIYDVSGILHHSGSVLSQREMINLSQLKTGIYIVVVGNERVKIMKK